MAGNPVGKLYVELSLDATKYTAAQKAILAGAKQNSADINKVFKTVGTQSDEMYNAMRKNIENSLNAIKRAHLSTDASIRTSADEVRRAKESAAKKITAINEQQFGKHTSLIDKLKANWMAASAAIVAAIYAIKKAWDMISIGAAYEEQRGILTNLAAKYNLTADQIVAAMSKAASGMIAKADLMQVALSGISKGLTPQQLINLSDAAKILSDTMGQTATEALKNLTEALETGRVRGLKMYMGTALDLEKIFGDLYLRMTETEKAQAMYSLTMIAAIKLQKEQTKEVSKTADNMERLTAKFEDFKLATAGWLVDMIELRGISSVTKQAADLAEKGLIDIVAFSRASFAERQKMVDDILAAQKEINIIRRPMPGRENVYQAEIDALKELLQAKKDNSDADKKGARDAEKAANEAKRFAEAWEKTAQTLSGKIETAGLDEFDKKMVEIRLEVEKLQKMPLADLKLIDTYRLAEEKKVIDKWYADYLSTQIEATEETRKQADATEKSIQKGAKETADAIKKIEEEKLAIQADFNQQYNEMGKSRFDLEREQLDRQVEIWREAKIKEDQINKLYSDKSIKIAQAEQQAKLAIYSNMAGQIAGTFMQIAQAGGKQSKAAFIAYKAFAMTQAGIAGYMAYLNTLASPLLIPPTNIVMANIVAGLAAVQIAMIAAAQPPSYDQGGISEAKGVYQTGNIREAHIPLPSGEKIPVKVEGEKQQQQQPTEINIINAFNPAMIDGFLSSARGQDAIINIIGNRSQTVRRILR